MTKLTKRKHPTTTTALTIFKIHVSIRLINRIGSIHASNAQTMSSIHFQQMFTSCVILQRFCCYFTFLPSMLVVHWILHFRCMHNISFLSFFLFRFQFSLILSHFFLCCPPVFVTWLCFFYTFVLTCLTNSFWLGEHKHTFVIQSFAYIEVWAFYSLYVHV